MVTWPKKSNVYLEAIEDFNFNYLAFLLFFLLSLRKKIIPTNLNPNFEEYKKNNKLTIFEKCCSEAKRKWKKEYKCICIVVFYDKYNKENY